MQTNASFSLENITFGYDAREPVIKGISLDIPRGEMTAVLGPNGCGKSTLFHLLCGSLRPAEGSILLDGQSIRDIPRREFARRVSIVHQYNLAPDDITVRKLVAMGRTPYHGMFSSHHTAEDNAAIDRALAATATEKNASRPVAQHSGGQRQRLAIACALVCGKEWIVLDEPTSGLDYYHMTKVGELLHLLKKQGVAVLVITHDRELAALWSDRIVTWEGI